jgi:DNA-binding response OmpR family regulator
MNSSGEQATKAGETVLVVEDEVLLRLSIAAYLRDCGYKVIEAADADEAVLVLKQPDLEIDVLFTDVEMAGDMDGFGLAQWTRANRPGLDVILTGSAPSAVNAAATLCEDGPLPKPYEPQLVLDRIRRLLAARPRAGRKRDRDGEVPGATPLSR